MAILFDEGFEHRSEGPVVGWQAANWTPTTVASQVHGGGAFGTAAANFAVQTVNRANFRINRSAARPVQARQVHMNVWKSPSTTGALQIVGVGDLSAGATLSGAWRLNNQQLQAMRGTTALGAVAAGYSLSTYYPFKASIFVDNTAGEVLVYRGEAGTPTLSVTSVDTQGGSVNYADFWYVSGGPFIGGVILDDVVIYAPSILLDVGGGAIAAGDSLALAGGGQVTVCDVDTSPDVNQTVSGTLVRVWVHSWNGTTFVDGAAATGGTLSSTEVVAPNADYQGGFEPYSWPQYQPVVGIYLWSPRWGADGTVNLTPVGSGNNFENVDNAPFDLNTYNEATSGANLADTYNTPPALPANTARIRAVSQRVLAQTLGTYIDVDVTLTDGSGSQSIRDPLPAAQELASLQICEVDSAGNAWTTTLPTSGTYELRV